jgi:hypothetical protein
MRMSVQAVVWNDFVRVRIEAIRFDDDVRTTSHQRQTFIMATRTRSTSASATEAVIIHPQLFLERPSTQQDGLKTPPKHNAHSASDPSLATARTRYDRSTYRQNPQLSLTSSQFFLPSCLPVPMPPKTGHHQANRQTSHSPMRRVSRASKLTSQRQQAGQTKTTPIMCRCRTRSATQSNQALGGKRSRRRAKTT